MKSYCIKTNEQNVENYLLTEIEKIDFPNLVYTNCTFSKYQNIIVHYLGENNNEFIDFLTLLICDIFQKFYEERIIKQILNYNYFYFDNEDKIQIYTNCINMMNTDEYEKQQSLKNLVNIQIKEYLNKTRSIYLDGFVTFRLKEYIKYLDSIIDTAVNQYVIEKEYNEFINMLRIYIESKPSQYDILHLIYTNGESILLDDEKNIVSVSDNIFNAKYLSDISFSSNDYALNTLLTLLPKKIDIHLIDSEDEFINTLKLIFEGRISICKECNICRTYKLIHQAKI